MRITASGVLIKDERFLLGLRSGHKDYYPNTWDIIGGHVEKNETPEATLVRELEEELGVTPTRFELVEIIDEPDPDQYGPAIHYIYQVRQWTGSPCNKSDEHQEIRWFKRTQLSELNLPTDAYFQIFNTGRLLHAGQKFPVFGMTPGHG